MEIVEILTPGILESAYRSGGEAAWPRKEAIHVVEYLSQISIVVIGVEVWLPTQPGPTIPTPFIYTWTMDPCRGDETRQQFIVRANLGAKAYIQSFSWDTEDVTYQLDVPYFNLTVDEDCVA